MKREFVVATRSRGKLRELVPLVREFGFSALSLDEARIVFHTAEDALEEFSTFEQNALAKARWFYSLSNGRPVLADDSGLAVDALRGMPGVRSKRWSGRTDLDGQALDDANNEFLWKAIDASEESAPFPARYVCAAACVSLAGEWVARGETSGVLVRAACGESGFGYDPYFRSVDLGVTFAEATLGQKAAVSHRGRAFRLLFAQVVRHEDFARAFALRGTVDPTHSP